MRSLADMERSGQELYDLYFYADFDEDGYFFSQNAKYRYIYDGHRNLLFIVVSNVCKNMKSFLLADDLWVSVDVSNKFVGFCVRKNLNVFDEM
jgi:hypothetical protein